MTKYIINGKLLAEAPVARSTSTLFFICPKCGSHWATVFVPEREVFPRRRPCPDHQWIGLVPGSIISEMDGALYSPMDYHITPRGMPPEVLAYELEVHMQAYEKGVFQND